MAVALANKGVRATFSYAGRVSAPRMQPIAQRVGGFGGVDGLAEYLIHHSISHVIDATHPFAAQMSRNAVGACARTGIPLLALTRPPWRPRDGDDWQHVADITAAVTALSGAKKRVMLALGRLQINRFAAQPQHHYVLRMIDAPKARPTLPQHSVIVARGPFTVPQDTALMREHAIELVVCKNAGGVGAEAKLQAARTLGIPVVMIDRPSLPKRSTVATVRGVFDWIARV